MDLNFINKDFKNYLKGISKDMRRQVFKNIAEKTDVRVSLKQIGDDALIPLHRLSKEEIRRYQSPSKPRNDEINKQSKHLEFTKKYSQEAKQDNRVSSSTSVKENYKHTKKKEETCLFSSNQFEERCHKDKIISKTNRTENINKPTKESSTNLYPNKENLKLTLIDLFEEEDNLKIPEHKLDITEMKASIVKKILEAKNLNKDKESRPVPKETKIIETPAIPVTPRKRGRPPKIPQTPKNPAPVVQPRQTIATETPNPKPKKEEKSSKSKHNTSILWKKSVEEYNKVKRIEYKRFESQSNPQRSSSDLPSSSINDRSPSCSPVFFRRHYISDSNSSKHSSIDENNPSSDSLDSSPDASLKISSTSSSIKTPPIIYPDKTKRRKSVSSDKNKTPTASRDSSEDSKHKRKSSDQNKTSTPCRNSVEDNKLKRRKSECVDRSSDRNKTPTSSRESPKDKNLKRRKSVCADRSSDECKTPSISRQSSNLSSDSEKPKRRKSVCADRSSDKNKTPTPSTDSSEDNKLKRTKSVYVDRSSEECKTPSISRQSSNLSSDSEKPKRRKSVCADRSSDRNKTPTTSRESPEDINLKRRKSICADRSSDDCNVIRKTPSISRQSSNVFSDSEKPKRRKSVCAEKSSSEKTPNSTRQSSNVSSENEKLKRRKSVCAEKSSKDCSTIVTGRQSSSVSPEDDKSKRRKSVSTEKYSKDCNIIESGRKATEIVRQSLNTSSEDDIPKRRKSVSTDRSSNEDDKHKRRKSVCAEKSESGRKTPSLVRQSSDNDKSKRRKSVTEAGRKTPSITRQSSNLSSEGENPKRRKSVCAEKSSNNSTNESCRKTPSTVRQTSSEDDKPKRRKSVCAERSSSGTLESAKKSQSKDDTLKRRKSVSKECATIESGRKSPRFIRQSSNVSSDTDGPKRKSLSTEKGSKDCSTIETGRKTPSISRQSSNVSETEKPKRRKSVSSKDAPNLLPKRSYDPPPSTNPAPVQKTPAKKINRSKSICVARSSEDLETDTSKRSSRCKTPTPDQSNKLKRRKSVSLDTSSLLLTPSREPKRQKCEDKEERSKEDSPGTPTRRKSVDESSNDYEAVKRRIFSDNAQKYTIPKRKPFVNEDTPLVERSSIFEDSVEEELEQIFKSSIEDRPSSRNKKRGVTPKPNDTFINYGDLVEQMKTTPSTKKNIDFVAPLATSTTEFSKPSYSKCDMTYDSVLVVDENRPNKILIRRRSVHDIQQTTSRTISRRHSFHFEEPLKQESNEEPETLKKPQRIFQRRKSVHEFCVPYDLAIKQNDSEDPPSTEEDLPMPEDLEITVDDQMKIDIHNIDIEKLFPTKCNEDVITLEVSSEENSPVRDNQDDFKDVKQVLKEIEVVDASSEDVKSAVIEISSDSDNSIETIKLTKNKNVSVIVKNPSIQSLTTDEAVQSIKDYFVSLLYIYNQYYKMADQKDSQISLGLNPNITLQKKYFNKRHDSDLAKLYQKLTEIRVAHFSLIVFFDKLTKVLKEEFKKYKEISEIVIINYLRRVSWILMESFTSPSDDKSLFNCITSYTSVEYLMNYKEYCNSNITDLDKKIIRIFGEISYKNGDTPSSTEKDTNSNNIVQPINDLSVEDTPSTTKTYTNNNIERPTDVEVIPKTDTNSNDLVQPKSSLSLPIINANDKSPIKPNPPQKRKCCIPKKIFPDITKSPPLNISSIDQTKTYLSSSQSKISDDLSQVLLDLNPLKSNQTEVPPIAEVTRKSLTSIEVTLKPQMVPKPQPPVLAEAPIWRAPHQENPNNKITILDVQVTRPQDVRTNYLKLVDQESLKMAQPVKDHNQNVTQNSNLNTSVSKLLKYLVTTKKPSNQRVITTEGTIVDQEVVEPEKVPEISIPRVKRQYKKRTPPVKKDVEQNISQNIILPTGANMIQITIGSVTEPIPTMSQTMAHRQPSRETNVPQPVAMSQIPNIGQVTQPIETMCQPSNVAQSIGQPIAMSRTVPQSGMAQLNKQVTEPIATKSQTMAHRQPSRETNMAQSFAQSGMAQLNQQGIGQVTHPIATMSQTMAHRQAPRETNVAQSFAQSGMAQLNQQGIDQVTQPIATMSQTIAHRQAPRETNMAQNFAQSGMAQINQQGIGQVTQPIATMSQTMAHRQAPRETNVAQSFAQSGMAQINNQNIGQVTQPIATMSQTMAHRQPPRETNVAQIGMTQLIENVVTSSIGQVTKPIATMARHHMPKLVMPQMSQEKSVPTGRSIGLVTQPIPTISQTMAQNHGMVRNTAPNMVPVSQAKTVTRIPEKMPQFLAQQSVPTVPYHIKERLDHMAHNAHHNTHRNMAQMSRHIEQAPRNMAQVSDERMVQYPTRFPDYMVQPTRQEQVARNMEYERMVRARSQHLEPYPDYMVHPNRYQSGIERITEFCYNYNRMAQQNMYRPIPNLTSYNSNITNNYTFNNHLNYNNYQVQNMDPSAYDMRPTMTYHHPASTINYQSVRPSTKSAPKGSAVPSTTSGVVQQPLNLNTINLSPNTVQHLPEALQEMPRAPHSKNAPQEKTIEDLNDEIHKRLALRNISRDSGYLSPSDNNLQQPDSDVICERCLGPSNLMCSGCLTFYCSTTCQQLAWPEHEKKCYTFNRNG